MTTTDGVQPVTLFESPGVAAAKLLAWAGTLAGSEDNAALTADLRGAVAVLAKADAPATAGAIVAAQMTGWAEGVCAASRYARSFVTDHGITPENARRMDEGLAAWERRAQDSAARRRA